MSQERDRESIFDAFGKTYGTFTHAILVSYYSYVVCYSNTMDGKLHEVFKWHFHRDFEKS